MTSAQQELQLQAAVEGQVLAQVVPPVRLQSGTVISYSQQPPARALVRADTTQSEIPARPLVNQPLLPGTRCMLAWDPDGVCFVIGLLGRVPYPGCVVLQDANTNVADNTEVTIGWDTTRANYGGMVIVSGLVQLPFTGNWSASATVWWNAINGTSAKARLMWVRIDRVGPDGTTLLDIMAEERRDTVDHNITNIGAQTMNVACTEWPCNVGDNIRVRVFQQSPNYGFGNDPLTFVIDKANLTVQWAGMTDDVVT